MQVLMFGWEFPPHNSGGLGTACYGLTKGLSNNNVNITLVLPHAYDSDIEFAKVIPVRNLKRININSPLTAYMTSGSYSSRRFSKRNPLYGQDLFGEVERYAQKAALIAIKEPHNLIHAHDWLTFKAGIAAKEATGKPLIIHVHATEFDRTGGNSVNEYVYNIEREGMLAADKIIAVSNFTKNKIIKQYGIPPEKIAVVHNAVEYKKVKFNDRELLISEKDRIILYLGRITLQKGPDYFIYAAKRILDYDPHFKFIIAGSGDMESYIIEKAAELDIADKVLFTGFLRDKDVQRAYQLADLYVMPSVSEPFGITPLEAMAQGVPCLISKQSGVGEVINHCLKVDFWDIDDMANKMISILKYREAYKCLKENASQEVLKFDWNKQAQKCLSVYEEVLAQAA